MVISLLGDSERIDHWLISYLPELPGKSRHGRMSTRYRDFSQIVLLFSAEESVSRMEGDCSTSAGNFLDYDSELGEPIGIFGFLSRRPNKFSPGNIQTTPQKSTTFGPQALIDKAPIGQQIQPDAVAAMHTLSH